MRCSNNSYFFMIKRYLPDRFIGTLDLTNKNILFTTEYFTKCTLGFTIYCFFLFIST